MARRRQDSYTGRGGQHAVLAELLLRGYNAAIPEIDEGTDVLAWQPGRAVAFLQVKTGQAKPYQRPPGYSAQFSVPLRQLRTVGEMVFVFTARLGDRFVEFLVIPQAHLHRFHFGVERFGSPDSEDNLILSIQFRDAVLCGDIDLTAYRHSWDHVLVGPRAEGSG